MVRTGDNNSRRIRLRKIQRHCETLDLGFIRRAKPLFQLVCYFMSMPRKNGANRIYPRDRARIFT